MKKLMIAAFIAVLSAQAVAFDDTEYANNEEYCEEIYWEDEYNCVAPGQSVTAEFCESIVFPDTREICFKMLKDPSFNSGTVTAEYCESIPFKTSRKNCLFRLWEIQKQALNKR